MLWLCEGDDQGVDDDQQYLQPADLAGIEAKQNRKPDKKVDR